jgi:hypothetical protein
MRFIIIGVKYILSEAQYLNCDEKISETDK